MLMLFPVIGTKIMSSVQLVASCNMDLLFSLTKWWVDNVTSKLNQRKYNLVCLFGLNLTCSVDRFSKKRILCCCLYRT